MNAFPDTNRFRERVVDALGSLLASRNSLSRCCAIRAIQRVDPEGTRVGERLLALLADPDPDVRGDAAAAVGHLRLVGAVKPLVEILRGDAEGSVRLQAVSALIRIGSTDVVAPLIHCLEHEGYPELDVVTHDLDFRAAWEIHARALAGLGEIGDARAVAPILALVESGAYQDLEESAFRALARIGTNEARRGLLRQLRSGGRTARRRAAAALAGLLADEGDRGNDLTAVRDDLVRALGDPEPTVRAAAARALAGCDERAVVIPLAALLADPEFPVREAAVGALAKTGKGNLAMGHLHEILRGNDEDLKRVVASALAEIGDETSTVALLPLLEAGDSELVVEAIRAIGRIGVAGAEDRLIAMVTDRRTAPDLRCEAAEALGQLARGTEADVRTQGTWASAGEALADAVAHGDTRVAFAALTALMAIDRDRAVARMIDLVWRSCATDRAAPPPAENTVPVAGAKPVDALPAGWAEGDPGASTLASILAASPNSRIETMSSEPAKPAATDPNLAVLAARLLGGMDRPGNAAIDALMAAAGCSNAALRGAAIQALAQAGDARIAPTVVAALRTEEPEVRFAALDALSRLARQGISGIDVASLLDDPDATVRSRTLRVLADVGGPATMVHVLEALGDEDQAVVRVALDLLTRHGKGTDCSQTLIDLLFRFSGELRHAAAAALRACCVDPAVDRLLARLVDPEQEEVQWICIDALGEMFAAPPKLIVAGAGP
jgi:HEAT repeat protein